MIIPRLVGTAVADFEDINAAYDVIEDHVHGDITKDGKVGTVADQTLRTGAAGLVVAGCPYDINDILTTLNATAPATRWPGTTWAPIAAGTFLTAAGTGYAAGATGGAATQSFGLVAGYADLSMFSSKILMKRTGGVGTGAWTANFAVSATIEASATDGTYGTHLGGTTDAGSILPPYLAVYAWQRTA